MDYATPARHWLGYFKLKRCEYAALPLQESGFGPEAAWGGMMIAPRQTMHPTWQERGHEASFGPRLQVQSVQRISTAASFQRCRNAPELSAKKSANYHSLNADV
jgi:hypothetical protein